MIGLGLGLGIALGITDESVSTPTESTLAASRAASNNREYKNRQGFDRHLFALKNYAQRRGKVPAIFEDESYKLATHFILSTSTLSTDTLMLGGFGPVVPDGFGIGYNVGSERLGTIISGYKDKRNTEEFASCFRESLDDIRRILEATKDAP